LIITIPVDFTVHRSGFVLYEDVQVELELNAISEGDVRTILSFKLNGTQGTIENTKEGFVPTMILFVGRVRRNYVKVLV
jgi:hypothetical protein